jgi:hypothetical protein
MKNTTIFATEQEFLKWVLENADFDHAKRGFVAELNKRFIKETGKSIPIGYTFNP